MRVNEIFKSIEGEGIRAGFPAIFIRLHGCNLSCSYCDTRYSCEGMEYKEKTIDEILSECYKFFPITRVTLTGGEPLLHDNAFELVRELTNAGYEVNIETNGSFEVYQYTKMDGVIVTMDWKSPSSGMNDKMLPENVRYLQPCDVLKFVVGSIADLAEAERIIKQYRPRSHCFISPVFGKISMESIVSFITNHPTLIDCRMQVQLHKIIWDPNKRGV